MQLLGFQAMLRNGFEKANAHGFKSNELTWQTLRLLMHDGHEVFLIHRPSSTLVSVGEIVFNKWPAHRHQQPVASIRVTNPSLLGVETVHSKRSDPAVSVLNPDILANMFHTEPPLAESSALILPTLSTDSFIPLVPYMAAFQTLFDPDMPIFPGKPPLTDINSLMGTFLTAHIHHVVDRLKEKMQAFPDLPWNALVLSPSEKRGLIAPALPLHLVPGAVPFACGTDAGSHLHYMGFPLFVDSHVLCPISYMEVPQAPPSEGMDAEPEAEAKPEVDAEAKPEAEAEAEAKPGRPNTFSTPTSHACPDCAAIACMRVNDVVPKVRIGIAGLARTVRAWFAGKGGFCLLLAAIAPTSHSKCILHSTAVPLRAATAISTIPQALERLVAILHNLHKKFISAMWLRKTELCVHDSDFQQVIVRERDGAATEQVEFISASIQVLKRLHGFSLALCKEPAITAEEGRVRLDLLRLLGHNTLATAAVAAPHAPAVHPPIPPSIGSCPFCEACVHSPRCSAYAVCTDCEVELCPRCFRAVYDRGAGDEQKRYEDPMLVSEMLHHTAQKIYTGAAADQTTLACCSRCKDCPDREAALAGRAALRDGMSGTPKTSASEVGVRVSDSGEAS